MIWFIIALPFVLTALSSLRWTRIAQREGYRAGSLAAVKRAAVAPGAPDRGLFIAVVVLAIIGVVFWPVAFFAAAVWFLWPRSIPFLDRADPVVWDRAAARFASTMVAVQFLLMAALFVVTVYSGLWALSLMPLLVITAGEWTLRLSGTTEAAA